MAASVFVGPDALHATGALQPLVMTALGQGKDGRPFYQPATLKAFEESLWRQRGQAGGAKTVHGGRASESERERERAREREREREREERAWGREREREKREKDIKKEKKKERRKEGRQGRQERTKERKGKQRKGKRRKGKERKGKEGKERKGKERKRKERKEEPITYKFNMQNVASDASSEAGPPCDAIRYAQIDFWFVGRAWSNRVRNTQCTRQRFRF